MKWMLVMSLAFLSQIVIANEIKLKTVAAPDLEIAVSPRNFMQEDQKNLLLKVNVKSGGKELKNQKCHLFGILKRGSSELGFVTCALVQPQEIFQERDHGEEDGSPYSTLDYEIAIDTFGLFLQGEMEGFLHPEVSQWFTRMTGKKPIQEEINPIPRRKLVVVEEKKELSENFVALVRHVAEALNPLIDFPFDGSKIKRVSFYIKPDYQLAFSYDLDPLWKDGKRIFFARPKGMRVPLMKGGRNEHPIFYSEQEILDRVVETILDRKKKSEERKDGAVLSMK